MAALTRKEVAEIATLARLHLEAAELVQMEAELGAILEHFGVIAAVDTSGVAPMTHAVPTELALRPDVVMPSMEASVALAAVPKTDGDLIVVPAIIGGGE